MSVKLASLEKLIGVENYQTWKEQMEFYFLAHSNGDALIDEPSDQNQIEKWRKLQKKCVSELFLTMESSLWCRVDSKSRNSVNEVLKVLDKCFSKQGEDALSTIYSDISDLKMDQCEDAQDYINKMTNLFNKMSRVGKELDESLKVAMMLKGLSAAYQPLVLGLKGANAESKITLASLTNSLINVNIDGETSSSTAFSGKKFNKNKANNGQQFNGFRKVKRNCYKCGSPNHLKKDCDKNKSESGQNVFKKNSFLVKTGCSIINSASNVADNQKCWIVDSGASIHMTPYEGNFIKINKDVCGNVLTANNATIPIKGIGTSNIRVYNGEVEVKDVHYVPKLATNLLSVSKITQSGNKVIFEKNECRIINGSNELVAKCEVQNGIYKLVNEQSLSMLADSKQNALVKWHRRFGHANYRTLVQMKNGGVTGMKFSQNEDAIKNCKVCCEGKQYTLPYKSSKSSTNDVLEIIHSDLAGPMENLSNGKARYILTFIDDYSREVFVYFLKEKSQVLKMFKEFKSLQENLTGKKIKILRSDNGTEYVNNEMESFCKENGIQHQKTAPYSPQQNGVAERMNRTLIQKAKCLLFDADLPIGYWAEAVNMAAYLINRTVTSVHGKTPEEMFTGNKVDVSDIKLFGTKVMVLVPKVKRKKWSKNSEELIFVGYDNETKGYRCINKKTRKVLVSRNVKFFEDNFLETDLEDDDEASVQDDEELCGNEASPKKLSEVSPRKQNDSVITLDDTNVEEEDDDSDAGENTIQPPKVTTRMTRATTKGILPSWLGGNLAMLCTQEFAFRCDDDLNIDGPTSFNEAINRADSKEWQKAMSEELESLNENKTWTLVDLPPGKKVVKSKWVFKLKRESDGKVARYKARLVAKGFTQRYGIDYEETYSPVVRYTSVRLLMALAASKGLRIYQMDAVTAFLQGDIKEEIYMEYPEGFVNNNGKVCKLNKAIYGLKQAGRQWNIKLDFTLKKIGLKNSKLDPCIYFDGCLELIMAIYVDDLLIFYENEERLNELRSELKQNFKMKDIGIAKSCIGIRIHQSDDGIYLDQKVYIKEILKRFGMLDAKPVSNPCDTSNRLQSKTLSDGVVEERIIVPYREAVGSLLFVAQATRPDIAFAVSNVSRFNNEYTNTHWKAVKRIFRYLNLTIDHSLFYRRNLNYFEGFSDADHAGEIDMRKSISGYIFKFGGAAVSWCSSRQRIVALSSTEAEYIALAGAVQEAIWLRQLSIELQIIPNDVTMIVRCDNQSTIKLALCNGYRPRTKHIDLRYHFLRDEIEKGIVNVQFIGTEENVADALTKAVSRQKLELCATNMGLTQSVKN
ncbi:hypothetical protein PVAND_004295 [Polypedilum vanderplanki]|uniref:Retrovirus-related Pol polyprotein from transposon TNT 1-94 n=1 Tax=Polypedilum vanderplanki TaxID=319348 RepID=A0A9J6BYP4_POLVA|nr:hypothetical protein PVAND_004295 [Polypedilum vanderplanki]